MCRKDWVTAPVTRTVITMLVDGTSETVGTAIRGALRPCWGMGTVILSATNQSAIVMTGTANFAR